MKKAFILGLVALMMLPLLAIGCAAKSAVDVPAYQGGQEAKTIEITLDDFAAQSDAVRDVELIRPGSLIVTLGSSPTTGYQWGEADISDTAVVAQDTHNFVEPQSDALGAPGKDVWVFDSKTPGTATITMLYARPWETGAKPTYAVTINVTVK